MRYVLLMIGLLCAVVGIVNLASRPMGAEDVRYGLIVQAGIVFLAVGLATIDIVEAIKRKRE
jgi:hypothetical protein